MLRRPFHVALALCVATSPTLAQNTAPGACREVPSSKACIDATPCKTDSAGITICLAGVPLPAGAVQVPQTCWQYSYQFACNSAGANTCTVYQSNPACSVVGSVCQDTIAETGQCDTWQYTYKCQTAAAQTTQQVTCSDGVFDSTSMATPTNSNHTFALAAITQEVLRQAQVYSQQGSNIFGGMPESCTKGYFGLKNCCRAQPGAKSNSVITETVMSAGFSVVKYGGQKAIDWASPYVFDAMYQNGIWNNAFTDAFLNGGYDFTTGTLYGSFGTNFAANGLTLSAWGFTYGTGSMTAGLFGANIQLTSFSGGGYISFNPYVFAAELVITLLQELMSCSQEEQLLGMHKGANLSVFTNEECSSKIPIIGTCIEWTDHYCSFNSILAKIINTQGKPQLGLDTANCAGLTTEQLSTLDFSKIDFSEFTQALVGNAVANLPASSAIQQAYTPIMQGVTAGSGQSGASAVVPTYQSAP